MQFTKEELVSHGLIYPEQNMMGSCIIAITRKSDGSVVRVLIAVHYSINNECEIPNISILYKDHDGNYRTAFYPLVLFDFEILDI